MRLINLQIFSAGQHGWNSDLLIFGDHITQLFGPNGCGKTPIVQSIAFCLGYPCVFRNDIYEKCSHAVLVVSTEKGNLRLKRIYNKEVDVEVTEPTGEIKRFYNELEYSRYIFNWVGLEAGNLITNANKYAQPYVSTMLPIFYLDQDEGYRRIYCPPSSYIKDQLSEMVRMAFNLPVKNSFDSKKEKIRAKDELDYHDKLLDSYTRQMETAKKNASSISKTSGELTSDISTLESQLVDLKNSGATHSDSVNALDLIVSQHRGLLRKIEVEIDDVKKRISGIDRITNEINTEIDTLNLNEDARRVFLSFGEVCGNSQCSLFSVSSDLYSKNLLYLKDQIKDLERNAKIDMVKLDQLIAYKSDIESSIGDIISTRNETIEQSGISALVDSISTVMNEIFALQTLRNNVEKVEALEEMVFNAVIQRDKALEKYASFSSEKGSIPGLIKIRSDLKVLFLEWLDSLNTSNISRNISFNDEFTPLLGDESISQLKGSTRIRAVLAYHAALIELMAKMENVSFGFLILDTPKQHEIHSDDLDMYFKALKKVCNKYDLQVVFSTTEYCYNGDGSDVSWLPTYKGDKQNMFLQSQ